MTPNAGLVLKVLNKKAHMTTSTYKYKQKRIMNKKLKKRYFAYFCCLWLLIIDEVNTLRQQKRDVNLTKWRDHRRQKRFILFENAGICKLVTGITYPVDLGDKRSWRQLVTTYNIQYQFPVPPRPIYYWDKWDEDRKLKTHNEINLQVTAAAAELPTKSTVDEAQMFLYELIVEFMNQRGFNGQACLQKAICENAQLHGHDGLFAELVYRILRPHKSLDVTYTDAFRAGQRGINCLTAFPLAQNCLTDQFLHLKMEVYEDEY